MRGHSQHHLYPTRRHFLAFVEFLEGRRLMDGDGLAPDYVDSNEVVLQAYTSVTVDVPSDGVQYSDNLPYLTGNTMTVDTAINALSTLYPSLATNDLASNNGAALQALMVNLDSNIKAAESKLADETSSSEANLSAYHAELAKTNSLEAAGSNPNLVVISQGMAEVSAKSRVQNDLVNHNTVDAAALDRAVNNDIAAAYAARKSPITVQFFQAQTRVDELAELGKLWSARHADRKQQAYLDAGQIAFNDQLRDQVADIQAHIQTVVNNPTGYVSRDIVGFTYRGDSAVSVMTTLKADPAKYFPFPIVRADGKTGPIANGVTYSLTPVATISGILRATDVTDTGFTLVVTTPGYIVAPGSAIRFDTVEDPNGRVILEHHSFVNTGLLTPAGSPQYQANLFLDQNAAPPTWKQQAARLRHDLGYTF